MTFSNWSIKLMLTIWSIPIHSSFYTLFESRPHVVGCCSYLSFLLTISSETISFLILGIFLHSSSYRKAPWIRSFFRFWKNHNPFFNFTHPPCLSQRSCQIYSRRRCLVVGNRQRIRHLRPAAWRDPSVYFRSSCEFYPLHFSLW